MVHNSSRVADNDASLRQFLIRFRHYDFDANAAEAFGKIKTALRKSGKPIPGIDVQIAAIALANNLILLTADSHFEAVPGLKHENWT